MLQQGANTPYERVKELIPLLNNAEKKAVKDLLDVASSTDLPLSVEQQVAMLRQTAGTISTKPAPGTTWSRDEIYDDDGR